MSKKARRQSLRAAREARGAPSEPSPPPTTSSSLASVWRRNGLWIALGLFVFANVALRLLDANRVQSSAFVMIAFLTLLSLGLAVGYGLEYALTRRRASLEGWDATRWKRWLDGH